MTQGLVTRVGAKAQLKRIQVGYKADVLKPQTSTQTLTKISSTQPRYSIVIATTSNTSNCREQLKSTKFTHLGLVRSFLVFSNIYRLSVGETGLSSSHQNLTEQAGVWRKRIDDYIKTKNIMPVTLDIDMGIFESWHDFVRRVLHGKASKDRYKTSSGFLVLL